MNSKVLKVRFLTSCAGLNFSYSSNQVVILPEAIAKSFISSGTATIEAETKMEERTREEIESSVRVQAMKESEALISEFQKKEKSISESLLNALKENEALKQKLEESENKLMEAYVNNEKLQVALDREIAKNEKLANKIPGRGKKN